MDTNASSAPEGRANLLGADRDALRAYFEALGEKPFRADQVLRWAHQHGVLEFSGMTNLGKALRERLEKLAELSPPEIVGEQCSQDGTRKWVVRVDSGNCVEMVYIPEPERGTLCVSSQAGCALNCTFCSTAQQGFNRNLTAAEIIGQLWLANRLVEPPPGRTRAVTNVVLMGMGEPLLNFENVVSAIAIMLDDLTYNLARRRVTLSTAGVVPGIARLAERCPVSLAVSLHAPDDALRDELVPLNRSYPIAELLDACRRYVDHDPKQVITFEYVMLDGVNDSPDQATRLARLLRDLPAKVNLIPFNPFPGTAYRRSPGVVIDRFRDVLIRAGIMTITRKTRGDDIDAACGQLAGDVQPRSLRVARQRATIPVQSGFPDIPAGQFS